MGRTTRSSSKHEVPQPPPTKKTKAQPKKTPKAREPSPSPPKKSLPPLQDAKLKKVVVKGGAPVDQYFHEKDKYHVLQDGGIIYDSTLNQSNVQANNNKFYKLQVLESDATPHQYVAWFRWGRVGFRGQDACILGQANKLLAINQYNYKKRDKLKAYTQVKINYQENAKVDGPQRTLKQDTAFEECKLPLSVKNLLKLIFDMKMINNQMKEIGYDPAKLPLGKLDRSSIKQGYRVLEHIAKAIDKKSNRDLDELSSEFYSIIPHNFGFANMRLFIIKDHKTVKEKLEMLKSIEDIQVATRIMEEAQSGTHNEFEVNYKKLKTQITPLDPQSYEYKTIKFYVENTHAKTHNNYRLMIEDIFVLEREGEAAIYKKEIDHKMLLWHGSRLTNYVGIISQGLRIAPPEAPVTGYMFGKGVYFADMVSKSANYCFTSKANNTGLMLLGECALGKCNPKYQADYYANNLPDDCSSTMGVGKTTPDPKMSRFIGEVEVPCGDPIGQATPRPTSLLYNQFILYDTKQVRLRYLLRLKFIYL